jgi:hypothetical protein
MTEFSQRDVAAMAVAFVVGAVAGGVLTAEPLVSLMILRNVALGGVVGVMLLFGIVELVAILAGVALVLFKAAQHALDSDE